MNEYRNIKIIKHALQHYIKRPNASEKDIEQEKRVLDRYVEYEKWFKEKNRI